MKPPRAFYPYRRVPEEDPYISTRYSAGAKAVTTANVTERNGGGVVVLHIVHADGTKSVKVVEMREPIGFKP